MWTCPKCKMKVDESMDVCWRCGTSVEGVEDPDFVTAEDSPAIDDPPIKADMAQSMKSPNRFTIRSTSISSNVTWRETPSRPANWRRN